MNQGSPFSKCVYYTYLDKVAVNDSQDNCISGTDLSAVRLYRCIVKAEGSRAW